MECDLNFHQLFKMRPRIAKRGLTLSLSQLEKISRLLGCSILGIRNFTISTFGILHHFREVRVRIAEWRSTYFLGFRIRLSFLKWFGFGLGYQKGGYIFRDPDMKFCFAFVNSTGEPSTRGTMRLDEIAN